MSTWSGLVACVGSGFAQVFRQIVSIRVTTLSHKNLVALIRHIKSKEASQGLMGVAQKRLWVSSLMSNSQSIRNQPNQPYSTHKCNTTKPPFGRSEVTLQTCSVWYRISPWDTVQVLWQPCSQGPLLLCRDEQEGPWERAQSQDSL